MKSPRHNPGHDHGPCEALTAVTLAHIAETGFGTVRRWRKGMHLWRENDAADSVFFILRGQVAIAHSDASKGARVFSEGQGLGELCFESQLRRNTATALGACEIARVGYPELLLSLARNRKQLKTLLYEFCRRLSGAESRVAVLVHRGADERLGSLLLQLSRKQNDHKTAVLDVKHDDLSDMAAMSRAHVTVTMGRFRDLGLVRYARTVPLTVNTDALEHYIRARAGTA